MKIKKDAILPNYFEKKAWNCDFLTCGTDEVGRGCLAGPLVISAAILPPKKSFKFLLDSKKLSEKQRNLAFDWITKNCHFSTVFISPRKIDRLNIYKATQNAMKIAILQLLSKIPTSIASRVKYVLSDAVPLKIENPHNPDLECYHMNYGETYSKTIAAASIVAKVTRDRFMEKINNLFPGYGFQEHKGYGTKQHLEAMKTLEKSIIHRESFLKKINTQNPNENQQSLF